jgi:site-specific recombinase XerD
MPWLFAMLTQLTGTRQFKTKLTLALAEKHSYKGFEMYLYIFGALGYFSHYPPSPYVFQSSRSGPLAHDTVGGIVERAGELAALPMPVHAHMLRHGTGYYLANRGIDTRTIKSYLGHNNIQHTVRYTELASTKFQGLWDG